jgi:hypothetical protein
MELCRNAQHIFRRHISFSIATSLFYGHIIMQIQTQVLTMDPNA